MANQLEQIVAQARAKVSKPSFILADALNYVSPKGNVGFQITTNTGEQLEFWATYADGTTMNDLVEETAVAGVWEIKLGTRIINGTIVSGTVSAPALKWS